LFPGPAWRTSAHSRRKSQSPIHTSTPQFRRAVAEWVTITAQATSDRLHFHWDSEDLIIIDVAAASPEPEPMPTYERIQPDADGRHIFNAELRNAHDAAAKHLDNTTHAALASWPTTIRSHLTP
jgi:hypothetical protein